MIARSMASETQKKLFSTKIYLHYNSYACVALPRLALLAVLTQVAILLETHFTIAMDEDL